MADHAHAGAHCWCQVPAWGSAAATLLASAHRDGWRLVAFKLTEHQARELEDFTGQRELLFGFPVLVKS